MNRMLLQKIGGGVQPNPFNLRVPIESEWEAERNSWLTYDSNGAINSPLKLPLAGARDRNNGSIGGEGIGCGYWSSTFESGFTKVFRFNSTSSSIFTSARSAGYTVRLITEGTFTQQQYNDNYENETVIINGLTYGFVYNPTTQRIWLDRNLGATQVATSLTDVDAYGDLFQWGRYSDGHEKRTSNTTNVQATTPQPPHGDFIIGFVDWLTPSDSNLWQGVDGINNPAIQQ